jgi:hypothetical protein
VSTPAKAYRAKETYDPTNSHTAPSHPNGVRPAVPTARGADAGATSDKYVRVTVYLATVLFLIGISGHFPVLSARYGLVSLGCLLVVFSLIQLVQLPRPPG